MNTNTKLHRSLRQLRMLVLSFSMVGASTAWATDIATAPLFTTGTTVVKPNVMFILDDSGSMGWDYLPDDADFSSSRYGRRTSQCNGVAFNPDAGKAPYDPPVDASGNPLGQGSLGFLTDGNARDDTTSHRQISPSNLTVASSGQVTFKVDVSGRQAGWYPAGKIVSVFSDVDGGGSRYMVGTVVSWNSGNGNLVIEVKNWKTGGALTDAAVGDGAPSSMSYYSYSGSQTAMDYTYPGNSLNTDTTFYKECNSQVGSTPGSSVFTLQLVTASSGEAQRFANWKAYYSTRMLMMKTATSRAFANMDDKFRIGFSTISKKNISEDSDFLNIRDFNSSQKVSFYSNFNSATPGSNTPLRGALSKAGRYYAKKITNQAYDPVQYSCQKNFTILSTDGYWNNNDETSSYGPLQLDGSTNVGNQDGGATERPQFDGNVSTTTTVEKWNSTSVYQRTTETPFTRTNIANSKVFTPTSSDSYKTYTLGPLSKTFSNSTVTLSNCSNNAPYSCRINIKTSANHGLSTGDSITLSGITVAGAAPDMLNGDYTLTKVDNDEYYVTKTGLPNKNAPANTPAARGSSLYAPDGCPAGQGERSEQLMTRDKRNITNVAQSTVLSWSTTQTQTVTATTPYTRTVVSVNGVQSSDTTTAGNTTTNTSNSQTVTNPTTSTTPAPNITNASPATDTTAWVASGQPVVVGCATAKGNDTAVVTGGAPTTNVVTQAGTNTTGSQITGTAVVSNGQPVVTAGNKTSTVTNNSSGGSSNTLADVAMYYYKTDLRNASLGNCTGALGTNICENNVGAIGEDKAPWQHMSTFTLSLGNSGTMKYDPNYETQGPTGDFAKVKNGGANWPIPSSGGGAVNIDDMWHAAVNGRGRYFSASDPSTLASSLNAALSSIKAVSGSSSAAATSTLQPIQGDNGVFIAQFRSSEWTGDLRAYEMNVETGAVPTSVIDANGDRVDTAKWSAGDKLTADTTRQLFYFRGSGSGNTGTLQPFTYATMNAGEKAYFDGACSKAAPLTQCTGLSGTALSEVNSGANMVSFLRGQPQSQYRTRVKVLGDIVNSSPVYVGRPALTYTENNYAGFKAVQKTRSPTLYVGANDGMLHAFSAEVDAAGKFTANAGTERWAYVPRLVMDNLYQLADSFYESKHQYFVDATPTVSDVWDSSLGRWRTILVGGLNAGGKGYYALDITDPAAPVALWEFTHARMGLSFGNPVITKRADGTWIVAFTSGYNNSDSRGYLFVVNAITGALVPSAPVATGDGEGLGKLNAWVDSPADNTAKRFYAGDLSGNVWRFEIDGPGVPAAQKVALLTDAGGRPQPITTIPRLAEVEANGGIHAVVFIGTGQYLGRTDVSTANQQSIYGIKDKLNSTTISAPRSSMVRQTVDTAVTPRKVGSTATPVNWATNDGWYVDLVDSAERINVNMELAFNTLTAAANLPGTTATDCTSAGSGSAWLYQINIFTGMGESSSLTSMVAGLSTVYLGSTGTGVTIVTKTDVSDPEAKTTPAQTVDSGSARRSAWRELID